MPLTEEQQNNIEYSIATGQVNYNFNANVEILRQTHMIEIEQKRARLEAGRLAKETLIEVARSKPVDERNVDANAITSFANILVEYIDNQ
jgi:hypothetical protein